MKTQFTHEQAVKAVQAIQQLHDRTGSFLGSQGIEPKQDSLAAIELHTYKRTESIFTAYSQGNSLIRVAADHLVAFTRTVTEPAESIAPWTITRAVLEASALSCWLLDTKINSQVRVCRSLALRYEGLAQETKFCQAANLPVEEFKVNKRIEEVETIAENLGFEKLRNNKGKRTGIGQVMPNITEIIRDILGEEANYRLFSAMTHAHLWAFSQLGFKKVRKIDFLKGTAFLMEKNLPVEGVLWLCGNVGRYFAQPLKCLCELYGWDLQQLNAILDDVSQNMGITPNSKLWHSINKNAGYRLTSPSREEEESN